MALTRKMLESMGLTEAQVQAIIDEHTSVTEAIKTERDSYKDSANKVKDLEKQLEAEKKKSALITEKETALTNLQNEYDTYKATVKTEKDNVTKKSLYENLLNECKVSKSAIESILNTVDFNKIELDEKGAITDKDNHLTDIKSKWGGFIVDVVNNSHTPNNPPNNKLDSYSYEDLSKMTQKEYDDYFNNHDPNKVKAN